jgi:hypothetical protein
VLSGPAEEQFLGVGIARGLAHRVVREVRGQLVRIARRRGLARLCAHMDEALAAEEGPERRDA